MIFWIFQQGFIIKIENIFREFSEYIENKLCYAHNDLYDWLQYKTGLDNTEMQTTFNCGIGMMIVVPNKKHGEIPFTDYSVLGQIVPCS